MNRLKQFYATAVGKKIVVALSGAVMAAFLVMHMAGNFKTFLGQEKLDHYAAYLRTIGSDIVGNQTVLWITRVVLLIAVALHVVTIIKLRKQNNKARPVPYHVKRTFASTFSARMMMVSGIMLLVFIIVHIAQFTLGWYTPTPYEEGLVYSNISQAFAVAWIACYYIAMMLVVCMHLYHGIWSFFQTLGLDNPDRNKGLRTFAAIVSIILFLGFSAVPFAFLTGFIGNETATALHGEIE